ncbi:MAG: hypothetical protein RLZZ227_213 [Pseudomonadota bacterium]|jgi:hypothetical protein
MDTAQHQSHEHRPRGFVGYLLSWKGLLTTLALAALSYYLLSVHQEHLAVALPYLILLACPLMHIFGHRGHGGHGHEVEQEAARKGAD